MLLVLIALFGVVFERPLMTDVNLQKVTSVLLSE